MVDRERKIVVLAVVLAGGFSCYGYEPGDAVPADFVMPEPLSLEESVASLHTHPELEIELVAAEPMTMDPVYFDWDAQGRLWIVEMADYPLGTDGKGKPGGRVRYLSDEDGDGNYDKSTLFLDGVNYPTGVISFGKGVLVAAAPEIFYAEDTDGDGKADTHEVFYRGFKEGNQQHRVNGFAWGLDGWLYLANGDSGGTIESVKTGETVDLGGKDLKIHPATGGLQTIPGRSQYGRSRDDWGNWFGCNNIKHGWQYVPAIECRVFDYKVSFPPTQHLVPEDPIAGRVFPLTEETARYNTPGTRGHITSGCSVMIHRGDRLGESYQNNLFACEPVHNLVHREIMEFEGSVYQSHRADNEKESEFLASTDLWFRPVSVKTGPDGAIYVADMHRYVIEHPEWIPEEWKKVLNLRAGEKQGRIYRVKSPECGNVTEASRLASLDNAQLIGRLWNSNGWIRDRCHRILVEERKLTESDRESLRELAMDQTVGFGAVHALSILNDPAVCRDVLAAPGSPAGVKITANRLLEEKGENVLVPNSETWDERLAFHVMQVLTKHWPIVGMGQLIGKSARSAGPDDLYLQAAVLAAVPMYASEIKEDVTGWQLGEKPLLFRGLLEVGLGQKDWELLGKAMDSHPSRFLAASSLMEVLDQRKLTFQELQREAGEALPEFLRNENDLVEGARRIAAGTDGETESRVSAIQLLARFEKGEEKDREVLVSLLSAREVSAVQSAAAFRLVECGKKKVVYGKWKELTGASRSAILSDFLEDRAATTDLLNDLHAGLLETKYVPGEIRQQLVNHFTAAIRMDAKELFALEAGGRDELVGTYLQQMSEERDVAHGKKLFETNCSTCHAYGGVGRSVGADLGALTDRSDEAMVRAILDPNAAVEDKFLLHTIELEGGEFLSGMVAAESDEVLELKLLDGTNRQVPRKKIVQFANTGISLMPEGLEAVLSPDDLRDLVAYLQTPP